MVEVTCPACAASFDIEPGTVELGDDVTCPACAELLEVLGLDPLEMAAVSFDEASQPNGFEAFEDELFDD